MIQRRNFLKLSTLLGLSPYINAKSTSKFEKKFKSVEQTIMSVQAHLFPKHSKIPSSNSMKLTVFLFDTIKHKSYDRDLRAFVIEGAKELDKRENGRFTLLTSTQKEKALRAYEETNYGSAWLSRIMTLSMEGLFSDPIYGSNINEDGWKTISSYGGFLRPKTKYMSGEMS